MKQRIILVSNRLPISISEIKGKLSVQRSNGGLATALSALMDNYDAVWMGWAGTEKPVHPWNLAKLRVDKRLLPVNIAGDLLHRFYENMSNGILWPQLHGFEAKIDYDSADWQAYEKVNLQFAKRLLRICKPTDTIWVQDYQLMLVPGMLRAMGVTNRIGFFLHTPFARPDCLAGIPQTPALLESLAQADVIGFQTTRDNESFTTALASEGIRLREGAQVQAFPIGVDFDAYRSALQQPAVQTELSKAAAVATDRKVVLSISRLDYTKGILEQLQAIEQLLKEKRADPKLLYKLIVAPSREDVAGYRELKWEIEQSVARINSWYGSASYKPIDFTYRNCGFEEVSAWYGLADVLLVTPRIDGMNLVVKEFIATKQDDQAALVMSNTIGAAGQLTQALLVDPQDVSAIADSVEQALSMGTAERTQRWTALRTNVEQQDVFWWFNSFIAALQSQPQSILFSAGVHKPRGHASLRLPSAGLLRLSTIRRQLLARAPQM
ncbi:MAG TPA: trehalose-6-phosphate synthase [Candidatus Saccharimonadales bacterium]|nr:trehalose-6-phosphate synthase [Candidatus Saccharimonadales bacterium]